LPLHHWSRPDARDDGSKEKSVEFLQEAGILEGDPIYPGAGVYEKSHIQTCFRNPNCIKGFFLPPTIDSSPSKENAANAARSLPFADRSLQFICAC
jgi:hypothetical protein